jgi:hypothetical protein
MKMKLWRGALVVAVAMGVVAPAAASTFVRASLDELIATNAMVLVGEVVDMHSYWNEDGTFILTDVRIAPTAVLKGRPQNEVKITILGGSVGDLTTLIVGGAELLPGSSYVLFLNQENLPGVRGVLTVRDHCQGVFDVKADRYGLRAVSQANKHLLVPDASGSAQAPGGIDGLPLAAMVRTIREIASREVRQEVN